MKDRVSRIFERIHNLQSNVEDEKQSKFKVIEGILNNFESNMAEISKSKTEKFQYLGEKIKELQVFFEDESNSRAKLEEDFAAQLLNLERNSKIQIENFTKERMESDKRLSLKLADQIKGLSTEMEKEYEAKLSTQDEIQKYLEQDLPQLQQEIYNTVALRNELEQKIFEQFNEQINELKSAFEEEKKEREAKEDEMILILKKIKMNVIEALASAKKDRENNEELLVKLVEQIIEKLKKEILELNI